MTLISAPAGYGKTTLISEWAALCKQPIAWLSLDESDSSPSVFLAYLINALQGIKKGVGEAILTALQSAQPQPMDELFISLLNEISTFPQTFILVLDDYHMVDSVYVDKELAFIVDHLPIQMHLVIASREDPPLALSRLRTRGQLTELRAVDMRFSETEASDFLNRVMGLKLGADEISKLESQTEGWAAGLQLAALCLQGRKETTPFIQSFADSQRFILDYLLEEVLHQQPEALQIFLLRTSILHRLCGSLCDAVLHDGASTGQKTLEELEHANLFIIPLDPERGWYRYHNLFRDLLQKRLGQTLTADAIKSAHLSASRWYQENGDLGDAFHHALAAGDLDRAAGLAESGYREMDDKFQSTLWLGWVKKIPQHTLIMHPQLCTFMGMAFSDLGELETSETYLQSADHYIEQYGVRDPDKDLPSKIALARAINAQLSGDLHATLKFAELTLQLTAEDNLLQHAQANIILGFTHWYYGDLEPALAAMKSWMESMEKIGNTVFMVASAFALADMLMALGRLREAKACLERSLETASTEGDEVIKTTAHHYLGLAMIALEQNDRETVERHI
ncbi:helix-turn-helix transcriptional regulator, partial [bacterium]|nr:helix-turn-helix transcriptional regulator [bacterium]